MNVGHDEQIILETIWEPVISKLEILFREDLRIFGG